MASCLPHKNLFFSTCLLCNYNARVDEELSLEVEQREEPTAYRGRYMAKPMTCLSSEGAAGVALASHTEDQVSEIARQLPF